MNVYPKGLAEYAGRLLVASGAPPCYDVAECADWASRLGLFEVDTKAGSWRKLAIDLGVDDVAVADQGIYAAGSGLYVSGDGGLVWNASSVRDDAGPARVVELEFMSTGELYIIIRLSMGTDHLYRVDRGDEGASDWEERSTFVARVSHFVLGPECQRMYVALGTTSEGPPLAMSVDRGASWARVSAFGPGTVIEDIALRPGREEEAYCVADGRLSVSDDGGATWRMIGGRPVDVQCSEVLPLSGSDEVIVGAASGELYLLSLSSDSVMTSVGLASWAQVKSGAGIKQGAAIERPGH